MERPQSVVEALQSHGLAEPRRLRSHLTTLEIAALFREPGAAHLWITDAFGDISRRVSPEDGRAFWQEELNGKIVEKPGFTRARSLGGTAYQVSEWTSPFPAPVLEVRRCD
jgi:hypothetical protein